MYIYSLTYSCGSAGVICAREARTHLSRSRSAVPSQLLAGCTVFGSFPGRKNLKNVKTKTGHSITYLAREATRHELRVYMSVMKRDRALFKTKLPKLRGEHKRTKRGANINMKFSYSRESEG